jgi:dTDP-4-amino-4,6-dideoxygalactose transaminase
MTMHKLDINYSYLQEDWVGEYLFHGTNIWDSARRLEKDMFRSGMLQCLSFGFDKPLSIGRGGAILLDDTEVYNDLKLTRYDGRDLQIQPWQAQKMFKLGYHYKPTIEEAEKGQELLKILALDNPRPKYVQYPDLRSLTIIK